MLPTGPSMRYAMEWSLDGISCPFTVNSAAAALFTVNGQLIPSRLHSLAALQPTHPAAGIPSSPGLCDLPQLSKPECEASKVNPPIVEVWPLSAILVKTVRAYDMTKKREGS
jgi:hypothetical protein